MEFFSFRECILDSISAAFGSQNSRLCVYDNLQMDMLVATSSHSLFTNCIYIMSTGSLDQMLFNITLNVNKLPSNKADDITD